MGTDDDVEHGLSPVNNFQPVHQFRDVTKMITVASDAEEQPKATETQTPTDSQARVGEVVPTEPLQPDGQDTTVTAEVTGEDTRIPAVEQESAEPSAQVAVGKTGVSETRESETTAQDTAQGAPADSGYEIARPGISVVPSTIEAINASGVEIEKGRPVNLSVIEHTGQNDGGFLIDPSELTRIAEKLEAIEKAMSEKNMQKKEHTMGDEEWSQNINLVQPWDQPTPSPVQPVETRARASMPVEFGTFRERYKALEDGHATRESEILKKLREREELLAQMEAKLDEENASLAAFKTDRLA